MVKIMNFLFVVRYSARAVRRNGLRTWLALLGVAVGIMAIVALQLIGAMVDSSLTSNIRSLNGGDLDIGGINLSPDQLQYFDQLRAQGFISNFTAVSADQASAQSPQPVSRLGVLFVDPMHYPLAGAPAFEAPTDSELSTTLQGTTVVVTQSLAEQMGSHVGDRFTLTLADGHATEVTVGGIVKNAGLFQTPLLVIAFSSLGAFHEAYATALSYTEVYADVPDHNAASAAAVQRLLQQHFADATIVTSNDLLQSNQQEVAPIQTFLRLAALAALLVGGLGVANTMQILLRRRTIEIAMLKACGGTGRDLRVLFGTEAALLGLSGGIVGTLAGIIASLSVRGYAGEVFSLALPAHIDLVIVGEGPMVGIMVAVLFSLLPIVEASRIRPVAVLRRISQGAPILTRMEALLLRLSVLCLFFFLALLIVHSAWLATALVAGAAVVLSALSLLFSLADRVAGSLPVPGTGPGAARTKLAFRNLARRPGTVTTQISLFVGTFALGLILVLGRDLQSRYAQGGSGVNAVIWTPDLAAVAERLHQSSAVTRIDVYREASFAPLAVDGRSIAAGVASYQYTKDNLLPFEGILGFDLAHGRLPTSPDFTLTAGRMLDKRDAGTTNVVVDSATRNAPLRLQVGDRITVQYLGKSAFRSGGPPGGSLITYTVVGFYQNNTGVLSLQDTLLGDYTAVNELGGSNALYELGIHINPARADAVLTKLQAELPGQVFVHSYVDFYAQAESYLSNVLLVLAAIALPALLGAAISVANTVALSLLDRRYELGVQKALGQTSRDVLAQIVLEQGVAAFIASLIAALSALGVVAVVGEVFSTGSFGPASSAAVPSVAKLVVASVALSTILAVFVSWNTVHRRPQEVLRYP